MRQAIKAVIGFSLIVACASVITPASAGVGRAVSLNALAETLKSGNADSAKNLCGITRAIGFIEDNSRRDIILIGEVDPSLPPLYTDDLVVSLRNVYFKYVKVVGRTRYYTPPGCSIDPDPANMRELQAIGNRLSSASDQGQIDDLLKQWCEVGRRAHKVRVMGVPFDSRFAKVMVDADFYMKRLVNGSVKLDVKDFESLTDLSLKELQQNVAEGKNKDGSSMSRFWFSPRDTTYEEEDSAVTLKSCPVQLLTEEEFLTEQGQIGGKGRPNQLAGVFAQKFSEFYAGIAAARPIYKELEGLFRLVAVARLIKDSGAQCSAMNYFLGSYRVATVPVSRMVLGLTDIKRAESTEQTEKGTRTFSAVLPSSGGVSMDVRPRRVGAVTRPSNKTISIKPSRTPSKPTVSATAAKPHPATLKRTVLAARKSSSALSWDFSISGE